MKEKSIDESLAQSLHAIWEENTSKEPLNFEDFQAQFRDWLKDYLASKLNNTAITQDILSKLEEDISRAFNHLEAEHKTIQFIRDGKKKRLALVKFMSWSGNVGTASNRGILGLFSRILVALRLRRPSQPSLAEQFAAVIKKTSQLVGSQEHQVQFAKEWDDLSVKREKSFQSSKKEREHLESPSRLTHRANTAHKVQREIAAELTNARSTVERAKAKVKECAKSLGSRRKRLAQLQAELITATKKLKEAEKQNVGFFSFFVTPSALKEARAAFKKAQEALIEFSASPEHANFESQKTSLLASKRNLARAIESLKQAEKRSVLAQKRLGKGLQRGDRIEGIVDFDEKAEEKRTREKADSFTARITKNAVEKDRGNGPTQT